MYCINTKKIYTDYSKELNEKLVKKNNFPKTKIGIIGTTSWGTALSIILARNYTEINLFARSVEEANQLTSKRINLKLGGNIKLPNNIIISKINKKINQLDLIIIAVPSQSFRKNILEIKDYIQDQTFIVSATKGLEKNTCKRMSEILEDELGETISNKTCVLSGPNLALEVISNNHASTVLAAKNISTATHVQQILNSKEFRTYTNSDIIGVELGGSLKNIIALGAGICDGLQVGDNAKAAFITRGLKEITRLAVASGANPETLSGLSGLGDLIATCSSKLSRNHSVGVKLAQGKTIQEIKKSMLHIAEGVETTAVAVKLAKKFNVELPITTGINSILNQELSVNEAISKLLDRNPLHE